jgi:ABC-type bacteriocin/lantibiotic exporter with double-glycine peptidase domain
VLDVSDHRRGDRGYFELLYEAIDGAELSALLDHLLQLDLSNFDHRTTGEVTFKQSRAPGFRSTPGRS